MLIARRILFYLFLFSYLIFCPFLILYAFGIIFKPDTQSLQKTGIVYLSTIPSEAIIDINRERFSETTPIVIRNLPPANYVIRISHKGYKPWIKTLPVKATQATSAENILLIPQHWNIQNIIPGPFQNLIPFSEHSFFLLKKGPLLEDIVICRWKEEFAKKFAIETSPGNISLIPDMLFPLVPVGSPFAEARVEKIQTIPGSPLLFIETETKGIVKFFWANLENNPPLLEDITDLFPTPPETITWDEKSKDTLYAFRQGAIDHIDIPSHTISPHIIENVRTFTLHDYHLYVLTNDNLLRRFNAKGEPEQLLLNDPAFAAALFAPYKKLSISVFSEKIILFLSEQGALISNQLPHQLVAKGIKGFKFDQLNNRLLVWKNSDIGLIDFNKPPEEGVFEKGPSLTWLDLAARNIREAHWLNNGAQILYLDGEKIFITETESFGKQEIHKIVKNKKETNIHYANLAGRLFFLEEKTGHLKSIKIIPRELILPLSGSVYKEASKADSP